MTLPTKTLSTMEGSTLPLLNADFVATVASSVADNVFKDPPKDPKGVRFAATMNIFCIFERMFLSIVWFNVFVLLNLWSNGSRSISKQ